MQYPLTFIPIVIISGSLFNCWMATANEFLVPPNISIGLDIELPDNFKIYQI